MSLLFGREAADVIDHIPHLVLGHLRGEPFHRGFGDPAAHDGEDLTIGRAVRPLGIDKVGRLRVQLLAGRTIAHAGLAMTTGATSIEQSRSVRDRLRRGRDRVRHFCRVHVTVRGFVMLTGHERRGTNHNNGE